jgi:hypothetical protein
MGDLLANFQEYLRTVSYSDGNIVVKALCHKPEGRGFETQ